MTSDMLVTVLVWAYAHGVVSSRRIEELCRTDVAFRVICAGNLPDHSAFARFRAEFGGAVGAFFAWVLVLCARLGMGQLGVVALDGMKIAASASKAANRTEEALARLAAGRVAVHAAADAAEDELSGEGRRGDEVPPDAWRPGSRDERIAAALAGPRAGREAAEAAEAATAEAFRERQQAGRRTGPHPAKAAVELAEENVARLKAAQQAKVDDGQARNAAWRAATGHPLRGSPPVSRGPALPGQGSPGRAEAARARAAESERKAAEREANRKGPGPVRNITDPDSRLMPVRGGFIQCYNTQNMTSSHKLIIATALTDEQTGCPSFEPMLAKGQQAATLIAAHHPDGASRGAGIGLVLADAGYCSEDNLTCPGPDRLIATGKGRDLEHAARDPASPGPDGGGPASQAMRERLKTPAGIAACRHRGHIAETPHGHIKHNMGLRQLSMRGKAKAAAQWTFAAAVHNLSKALTTSHLTGQALTALAGPAA
jgi:hypothetical protein